MFVLISAGAKLFVYLLFFLFSYVSCLNVKMRSCVTFLLLLAANSAISDPDCAALAFNQIQSDKNLPNVSNQALAENLFYYVL